MHIYSTREHMVMCLYFDFGHYDLLTLHIWFQHKTVTPCKKMIS